MLLAFKLPTEASPIVRLVERSLEKTGLATHRAKADGGEGPVLLLVGASEALYEAQAEADGQRGILSERS